MKAVTRVTSFFSNWMAEVMRQPALMASLIVGPFLVLLAFGEGVDVGGPRPNTLVVNTGQDEGPIQPLPEELNDHINVVGETSDLAEARRMLRDGEVDAVAILPPDPMTTIQGGQHVPLTVIVSEIDPIRRNFARSYLRDQVAELNRRTIEKAIIDAQSATQDTDELVEQARGYVQSARAAQGDLEATRGQVRELKRVVDPLAETAARVNIALQGVGFVVPGLTPAREQARRLQQLTSDLQRDVNSLDQRLAQGGQMPTDAELAAIEEDLNSLSELVAGLESIPPEVLSAPFELQLENISPTEPTYTRFYSPAVLALLLQHLAITLGALSMARIRLLGVIDMLRVAPVKVVEVMAGNYLAYGAMCAAAAAVLVAVLMFGLDVPMHGSYFVLAAALVLLIVAALGVGFLISMLSSSEQQAAQMAMLVLLASTFFSGFLFSLDRIEVPVRWIGYVLPATFAIRSYQDVMLRGVLRHPEDLLFLGLMAAALFLVSYALFRREFRPR